MKIALIAAAALSTAACATTPGADDFVPGQASYVGYVRFAEGEFQLHPREQDVRTDFSRPCVSGVLPRNQQEAALRDLSGQKVEIFGRTQAWAGPSINHEGSFVRNTCGGDFVLLASRVEVIR